MRQRAIGLLFLLITTNLMAANPKKGEVEEIFHDIKKWQVSECIFTRPDIVSNECSALTLKTIAFWRKLCRVGINKHCKGLRNKKLWSCLENVSKLDKKCKKQMFIRYSETKDFLLCKDYILKHCIKTEKESDTASKKLVRDTKIEWGKGAELKKDQHIELRLFIPLKEIEKMSRSVVQPKKPSRRTRRYKKANKVPVEIKEEEVVEKGHIYFYCIFSTKKAKVKFMAPANFKINSESMATGSIIDLTEIGFKRQVFEGTILGSYISNSSTASIRFRNIGPEPVTIICNYLTPEKVKDFR